MSHLLCTLCLLLFSIAADDSSKAAQAKLDAIRSVLREAGASYREERFADAKTSLDIAKEKLAALPSDVGVQKAAAPLRRSWLKAEKLVVSRLEEVDVKLKASDAVSFTADLAPQIVERCIGCHGGNRARQDLRLHTFAGLMKGSESGDVIDLPDPENSLIVLKMKGEADDDRMPPNGRPMPDEWIAKFEQWISEGAKFDGQNPGATLRQEIQSSRRIKLTSEELTKAAEEVATQNWKLAFPQRAPAIQQTESLLIVASPGTVDYTKLGKQADAALADAIKLLGLSKDSTVKGALTLYVIPRRYDFSEWAQMVEKRTSTSVTAMHWRSTGGLGYVVLGPNSLTEKNELEDKARLTQMLTSALLGQWGSPTWYAEGRGLLTRGQTNRRDIRSRQWKLKAAGVLPKVKRSKEIFEAELPTDQADTASWAFASFLESDRRRSASLHTALQEGQAFDVAFARAYGKPADEVCDAWLKTFRYSKKRRK